MPMTWFERIKGFYDRQLWTADQVKEGVSTGTITPEEYKLITDVDYESNV